MAPTWYEPKVTLGNLIQLGVLLVSLTGLYWSLMSDVKILQAKLQAQAETIQSIEKEFLRKEVQSVRDESNREILDRIEARLVNTEKIAKSLR